MKDDFKLGEIVIDDLTQKEVKIIKLVFSELTKGLIGVRVNNKYLNGDRHIWEITKIKK